MLRFILGVVIGFVAARMLRPDYVDTKKLESGLADVQKRAEAVLVESRHVLDETRQELASAVDASRTSVQEKAGRIRTAAAEPERVIGHPQGEKTSQGENVPRPSSIE
ncbi:MAG: hypothetical protein HYY30_03080 [Chloroflexi bacterium]|nr:hypothetical protein [Chloroflexota bacterium]